MPAKTILFAENSQTVIALLQEKITSLGYQCVMLNDPSLFISEMKRLRPQLILLDVDSPEMNGFSLLETLRINSDAHIARTPVIIGSGSGDLIEIGRALQLGIVDYYVKTAFNPEQVIEKIKRHIGAPDMPSTPSLASEPPKILLTAEGAMIKLLIVEDDKFLRDLAAQKLAREQLQVFTAVDGEQGIALAEQELPNVILLDILLPGIDGFEVLKRVRANPALSKTNVAMLSNFGQREDIEKALGLGADQFFIKANYTLDEIVEEVKKMIANPRK